MTTDYPTHKQSTIIGLSRIFVHNCRDSKWSVEVAGASYPLYQFRRDFSSTVHLLRGLKLKPKDCIAFAVPKCYDTAVSALAADAIGLKLLCLSDELDLTDLEGYLRTYGAKACFVRDFDFVRASQLVGNVPTLEIVLNTGTELPYCDYFRNSHGSFVSYSSLLEVAHYCKGAVPISTLFRSFTRREILVAPDSPMDVPTLTLPSSIFS